MSDLIAKLEAAEAGSRELDVALWRFSGEMPSTLDDPNSGDGKFYMAPNYTTSLDATLPGENIIAVWRAPGDKTLNEPAWHWRASQRQENGDVVYGYAHTEALARRIAALKAMLAATGEDENE